MAFIKLERSSRYNENIIVNTDEVSTFYEDRYSSYTDYIVVMKNGEKHNITYESYKKLLNCLT